MAYVNLWSIQLRHKLVHITVGAVFVDGHCMMSGQQDYGQARTVWIVEDLGSGPSLMSRLQSMPGDCHCTELRKKKKKKRVIAHFAISRHLHWQSIGL